MQTTRTAICTCLGVLIGFAALAHADPAKEPLRLHPDNPRYFEFRGQPAVLITSGEHYGAVINLDFDYIAYLDELEDHGFNRRMRSRRLRRQSPGRSSANSTLSTTSITRSATNLMNEGECIRNGRAG